MLECIKANCTDLADAKLMLQHFLSRLAKDMPQHEPLQALLLDNLRCAQVLPGLANLREQHVSSGASHKPSISLNELDSVLVDAFQDRQALIDSGYPLTQNRYATVRKQNFSTSSSAARKPGRPSMLDNEELLESIRKVLDENTKESERVAVIGSGNKKRMVIAKHLTKTKHRLWTEQAILHKNVSWTTFVRIMKRHFPYIRKPRRNTDVCKHCKHLSKYLLPEAKKVCNRMRQSIFDLLPTYFQDFDSSDIVRNLLQAQNEIAVIKRLHRYIEQRNAGAPQDPIRRHLSRATRASLHDAEARAVHLLKGHVELLEAYEWHQISAKRQGDHLASLRNNPAVGVAILQTDFKENVKYPLGPDETGEEWHAQNKLSLTVFGANALVPARAGGHIEFFVLVVTDVLDHDAQAANMLTNTVLARIRTHPAVDWPSVKNLVIVADCGPHFRSKENVAHYCVTLPLKLQMSVEVCWLGEQHGKSGVDRCFGWCNSWIDQYIVRFPIYNLDDLVRCFEQGSSNMMQEDTDGAKFLIIKWNPGTHRPTTRYMWSADNFKISRTYSLSSSLSSFNPAGVSIKNKVFSDINPGTTLTWERHEVVTEEPEAWRVGYYDKARSWEEKGPEPGDVNSITRRYNEQKHFVADVMPNSRPTFLQRVSSKALTLRKQAAKKARKLRQLRGAESSSSSSSSSTSSESASDNEPEPAQ